MQIKYLPKTVYQLNKIANNDIHFNDIASKRILQLNQWERFKAKGLNKKDLQDITGISQATYYRLKKAKETFGVKGLDKQSTCPHKLRLSKINPNTKEIIYKIRKENPTYGKAKLTRILVRDHDVKISESSVGRVITKAIKLGQVERITYGKIKRKARIFNTHAQRWRYGMKGKMPGELIQIDHMSVTSSYGSHTLKHFTAYDRCTKMTIHEVYSNASSASAAKFLEKILAQFPFQIRSIQVDGGSEFMKDFEALCAQKNIPLYVLPPKSPKLNGGVERCNKTSRHEFYQFYDGIHSVSAIRPALERFAAHYNTFRPHRALDLDTPFDYYLSISREVA